MTPTLGEPGLAYPGGPGSGLMRSVPCVHSPSPADPSGFSNTRSHFAIPWRS